MPQKNLECSSVVQAQKTKVSKREQKTNMGIIAGWMLPLGDLGVTIGQCRSGGIMVAAVSLAHGADNVVPDKEASTELHYHIGVS